MPAACRLPRIGGSHLLGCGQMHFGEVGVRNERNLAPAQRALVIIPRPVSKHGQCTNHAVCSCRRDADLANLRVAWRGQFPHGDLDRDGDVDEADRDVLLAGWGRCE